jgi:uncharacterized protein (UPF0332 family)
LTGEWYGTAVNRANYAFFYAASGLILTKGIVRKKHSGVLSDFRQHFVKTGLFQAAHRRNYGKAFDLRQEADYDLVIQTNRQEALETLENARRFLADVRTYLQQNGLL